jgi:hypothetical protein
MKELMRDSAYAANIPEGWQGAVGGYLHGGDPIHPWPASDWRRFRYNRKLPIFAQSHPAHPIIDAQSAIAALRAIGAPPGVYTALDLEAAVDPPYVRTYGKELRQAGYKVWVYGQASTVFGNPALNGYWVANFTGYLFMHDHPSVRATQYADQHTSGGPWDSSTVKDWTYGRGQWWR